MSSIGCKQLLLGIIAASAAAKGSGADCNSNGADDAEDITSRFLLSSAPRYPVNEWATSMAAADLDRDGDVDLAVGAPGLVSVLRNRGDGTFEQARDHAVASGRYLTVADLDGDGSADLASTAASCRDGACSSAISVLLNNGDGTFQPAPSHTFDAPAHSILAADLDGDNRVDLVTLGSHGDDLERAALLVFLNNGGGTFRLTRAHEASERLRSLVASDLDRDGRPELAILSSTSVLVLFNDGRGAFGPPESYPLGETPVSLAAADLDGDGWFDLAAARAACLAIPGCGGAVAALLNNGDRTFRVMSYPSTGYTPFLLAEDLSGDGRTDLAAVDGDGSIRVRLNTGQGRFPVEASYGDNGGWGPIAARAADLDGDGSLDLLTAGRTANGVSVLMNRGDGTFTAVGHYSAGAAAHALAVADFDGDSRLDAAALAASDFSRSGWVAVLRNRGDGVLEGPTNHAVESGPYSVLAADFDADGLLDLATPNLLQTVSVLLNAGEGFHPASHYPVRTGYGSVLTAADIDGDDKPELIKAAGFGSAISVLANRGDGTFHAAASYPVQLGVGACLAVDANRDGLLDLVGVARESLSLLFNRGAGVFGGEVNRRLVFGVNRFTPVDLDGDGEAEVLTANAAGASSVLVREGERTFTALPQVENHQPSIGADLDGDGDLDLVAAPWSMSVFLTGAGGTFDSRTDYDMPLSDRKLLVAADLNEDGLLDLAGVSIASLFMVFLNDGGGVFAQPAVYSGIDAIASSFMAADLDLDGFRDLVASSAHRLSGGLTVILNRGDGSFGEAISLPVGGAGVIGYRSILAADLNRDGKPDLVSADLTGWEGTVLTQGVTVLSNLTLPAASRDGDRNGVPDECEPGAFHRGDPNGDGRSDITDAVAILDFLFLLGAEFACMESADANDDAALDVSDPVFLLLYLFGRGRPPPYPGPPGSPCGLDADPAAYLGCSSYERCI